MTKCIRNGLVALTTLGVPLLQGAFAAEIPPGLDQRGQVPVKAEGVAILEEKRLPAEDAGTKADALDQVELAELARSDPSQKGGGVISTVVIVAGILILLLLL